MVVGSTNHDIVFIFRCAEALPDSGYYWAQKTSDIFHQNGKLLRDTLLEGRLEATNHRFEKP